VIRPHGLVSNPPVFIDDVNHAFSSGGVNAVLHREGEVICILASEMPMEELLALAKAKAKPSQGKITEAAIG